MQQTTTYKLNKPESTDTFSVSPLNENADKLEAQLARLDGADAAETAARTAETAALDARVTVLELKKIVVGHYVGTGGRQPIALGFTPIAVLLHGNDDTALAVTGSNAGGAEITETGFMAREDGTQNLNTQSRQYNYIAFG